MKQAIFFLLFTFGTAQASTVTIDFEEFSEAESNPLASQGYSLNGYGSGYVVNTSSFVNYPDSNTNIFLTYDFAQPGPDGWFVAAIELKRSDGDAFALWSADWVLTGESENYDLTEGFSYVEGVLSNGEHIFASSVADLGQGDWLNIESALFVGDTQYGGYPIDGLMLSVDNIVVSAAVPVPAAVWFFGSALAGLGWLGRRKQLA